MRLEAEDETGAGHRVERLDDGLLVPGNIEIVGERIERPGVRVLRLVAFRMELEGDVDRERRLGADRVRVEVEVQRRARGELDAERVRIDRRVLPELPDDVEAPPPRFSAVDVPDAWSTSSCPRRRASPAVACDDRVVHGEVVQVAGLARRGARIVPSLPELHRLDVPVLGQTRRSRTDAAIEVRSDAPEASSSATRRPDRACRWSTRRRPAWIAGMSAGLPRGAPVVDPLAQSARSPSSVSDGSSLNFWIPTFFSMNQGGIRSGSSGGATSSA